MRKDVKRSLILWPAMATAIVALMSGYTIIRDISRCLGPDTNSLAIATQPSFDFDTPALTNIPLSSRGEHGRRAMELPERVANVLGISLQDAAQFAITGSSRLLPDRQIEGMILPPWGVVMDTRPATETVITSAIPDAKVVQIASKPIVTSNANEPRIDISRILDQIVELTPPASVLPKSNRVLAKPQFNSDEFKVKPHADANEIDVVDAADEMALAAPRLATRKVMNENRKATFHFAGWPATKLLDNQLENLAITVANVAFHDQSFSPISSANIDRWVLDVISALQELQSLPRLGDDDAARLIDRLRRLAAEGVSEADKVSNRSIQVGWLQASYAISRRAAIWKPVWQLANANASSNERSRFAIAMKPESFGSVHAAIDRVRSILPESGDASGWERYLLLERIDEAASSADQEQRMAVAKQFVSRRQRRSLHPAHQKWLQQESIHELQIAIQPWARGVVDYADLLSLIERQESTAGGQAAGRIADAMHTLRVTGTSDANKLADSIDTYYRNANVRVAISESMLQRLVPEAATQSVPVRTHVQGSRVRGQSKINSELQVSLVPSIDRWTMHLQTIGKIQTNVTGVRGPVSVRTQGDATFSATTAISIRPHGIDIGKSAAAVRGRTMLRGIQTDYDGWPVVGNLVRVAATRRFDSMSAQSNRMSNQKIAAEIESKVDTEFHQRVGEATEQLGQAVLGPLGRLQLDPMVTDMRTTEDRLIARYRLAGDGQLAACTARPRAISSSLLSVQVHQSAINNALESLVPTDEPTSIRDAIAAALEMFSDHEVAIPDDIPSDVTIQFSRTRPITAEFKDNVFWLTLRVVRLKRGERLNLTKFIVQAQYRPEVDGIEAKLVREGHLRISGPGMSMRERLPVRAIFNKILASSRSLPLTVPAMTDHPAVQGLAIHQLELRDGWIGLAIADADSDRVASTGMAVE